MDYYLHDKFYNTITCDRCHRNTYYNNYRYYCISCKNMFYTRFRKVDNRCKISVKNNCKIQHFKKILHELMSYNIPEPIWLEYNTFLTKMNINNTNINICVVDRFLKQIGSHNIFVIGKYHLLNKILYDRVKPSVEEINESIKIFNVFITFIQDIDPSFTMKYDFYVHKIFKLLDVKYDFSKMEYKDNSKKNKDTCNWTKFVKYGLNEYRNKEVLSIPNDPEYI